VASRKRGDAVGKLDRFKTHAEFIADHLKRVHKSSAIIWFVLWDAAWKSTDGLVHCASDRWLIQVTGFDKNTVKAAMAELQEPAFGKDGNAPLITVVPWKDRYGADSEIPVYRVHHHVHLPG
jgi:hypothetical protein